MKKITALIILSFLLPAALISQDKVITQIRLAVIPFDDTLTKASELEKSGNSVSSMIENCFKKSSGFYVREKNAIESYLAILARVQAGLIPPDAMKGDPETLKIDFLTVGTVSKIGNRYELDVRTVSVDNMLIVHSHGSSGESLAAAAGDIEWHIKEKFSSSYLSERLSDNDEKSNVTVFRFRDMNESAGKAGYGGTFAEILNSQLGSFLSIGTVERKYSRHLVNEKILEMAGVIENDESSRNFSNKGIQYKVDGDIRVFSDVICINYKIIDTSNNFPVFIGSRDISSSSGLRPAAWSISNIVEDALSSRIGTLKISTVPAEAEIYIDGRREGKSPALLSFPRGNHRLLVKMEGYAPYKTDIVIEAKKISQHKITLQRVPFKQFMEAMNFEKKQNWTGAIAAYAEFINAYDETKEADAAYYRKGHIEMMYLKDYQTALKTFEALVKRYPDAMMRAEGYYGMMKAYELMGNKQKASETKEYLLLNYGETSAAAEAGKTKY